MQAESKQYNSSDRFYYQVINYNYILIYYKHCNLHGLPLPVTNYTGNIQESLQLLSNFVDMS
jgi:hypothetical protein